MDYQTLVVDNQDDITTVTITRPEARNALSARTLTELRHLLDHATTPLILTGSPGPAFVAGADIREMAAMTPEEGEEFGRLGQSVTSLLESVPVPVIACVDGYALGGGCEIALACDFVYATEKSVFGQPEVLLGLIPGFGGCVRLQQQVGPARAREMIYSGKQVDAAEAYRIGLVNHVYPAARFAAEVAAFARRLADGPPLALQAIKANLNASLGPALESIMEDERIAQRWLFTTADVREGVTAFIEKRPARFKGE